MKYFTALLSCLIFLFSGCNAEADTKSQQSVSTDAISLSNGILIMNSQPIHLPQPIDNVIEKLSPYSRFAEKGNDIYTWDNLGFLFWSKPHKKIANQLGVYIRKKRPVEEDKFSPTGTRFIDSRPKQDFSGTLILDGVKITRTITFEALNAKKTGPKFNGTHWADQFKYYSKVPGTGQSYRVIVYLHEDRTINYVEIVYEEKIDSINNKERSASDSSKTGARLRI